MDWQALDLHSSVNNDEFIRRRIDTFKMKLRGRNPKMLMLEALKNSRHSKTAHYENIKDVFEGIEVKNEEEWLTPEKLIQNLIEISCDKKILGRLWTGWMAQV